MCVWFPEVIGYFLVLSQFYMLKLGLLLNSELIISGYGSYPVCSGDQPLFPEYSNYGYLLRVPDFSMGSRFKLRLSYSCSK